MRPHLAVVVAFVAVAGCAAPKQAFVERFDGAQVDRIALEQATTECTAKAQVISAGMPYGYGSGAYLIRSVEQRQTQHAALTGCMAEKGMKISYQPVDGSGNPVAAR